MIRQATDNLEKYIGNKYALVIVSAKRARQLKEGHPPLSRDPSPNPLSIALKEIEDEKIQPIAPPVEELAPAPRDVIASLVAGTDFDLDEDLDLEDSDAVDDLAALLVGADEDEEEAEDPLAAADTEDVEPAGATEDEEEDEEETVLEEADDDVDVEDEDE
jgi:DNA-directed RNA polymerase subunit omega